MSCLGHKASWDTLAEASRPTLLVCLYEEQQWSVISRAKLY